jgi:hypothetical protein
MVADAVMDRECLPVGFGTLPLTRLVMAPYAFNTDARGVDPLAELRGLRGLQQLILSRCQVNDSASACELPAAHCLAGLTALTSISLAESPSIAGHLPPMMEWSRMVSADLSQCRLRCLSGCILQASNLRELDLTLNDLEEFPSRADWSRLEILNLNHNRLSCLPEVPAPSLRELNMSYNSPLLQLRACDVTMLNERWPQLTVLDMDRGKTVDVEQGGKRLVPPVWTASSLTCAFEALGRAEAHRDVRLILHRGPVAAHECVLRIVDVRDDAGEVLSAHEAFARRFEH